MPAMPARMACVRTCLANMIGNAVRTKLSHGFCLEFLVKWPI
jgi:hypothetical protein